MTPRQEAESAEVTLRILRSILRTINVRFAQDTSLFSGVGKKVCGMILDAIGEELAVIRSQV